MARCIADATRSDRRFSGTVGMMHFVGLPRSSTLKGLLCVNPIKRGSQLEDGAIGRMNGMCCGGCS